MDLEFAPDWSAGVTETFTFATATFRSRSGKEQRIARRELPYVSMAFRGLTRQLRHRDLIHTLTQSQVEGATIGYFAAHPFYLSAPASAGTNSVQIELSGASGGFTLGFAASGYDVADFETIPLGAYCLQLGETVEFVEIESILGPNADLAANLQHNWPAGSSLYPVVVGTWQTDSGLSFITNQVAQVNVRFALDPVDTGYTALGYRTEVGGFPIFDFKPDWNNPLGIGIQRPMAQVQYGMEPLKKFDRQNFPEMRWGIACQFFSREEADLAVAFFHLCRGAWREFHAPTWLDDLSLLATAQIGDDELFVSGAAVTSLASGIYVTLGNGQGVPLLIESIDEITELSPGGFSSGFDEGFDGLNSGTTFLKLTLTEPLAVALPQSNVANISWMPRCRFASDQLTVERITNTVTRIQFNLMSLEALT